MTGRVSSRVSRAATPIILRSLGIQCKVFSPIYPFVSTKYNYRDHRKIVVIDGETGFTGGANLADEYINRIHPYGRWKDAAIRLRGRSVKSLTLLFLQMWHADDGDIFIGDLLKGEDAPRESHRRGLRHSVRRQPDG